MSAHRASAMPETHVTVQNRAFNTTFIWTQLGRLLIQDFLHQK